MAVKIRLTRIGKKHSPIFRIVATDARQARDGEYLDYIGTYNPVSHKFDQFHEEKMEGWIKKGAIPTDSVKKLYKMYKKAQ